MIYTGFFDKIDAYEKEGLTPVSIAGRAPENYHGFEYRKLAPKYDWWKKWHDERLSENWYNNMYQQTVLDKLSARDVYDDLHRLGENVVLLCYEESGQFCHRNLVADWFEENGFRVQEYRLKKENKMDKANIRVYESDEDAMEHISSFEKDWDYDPVEYSATHVTGLKLLYQEKENGDLDVISDYESYKAWAAKMCHEGLTGREVAIYRERLAQEFEALSEKHDEKIMSMSDEELAQLINSKKQSNR